MLRRIALLAAIAALVGTVGWTSWPKAADHGVVAVGDPDFVTAASSGATPFTGKVTDKSCGTNTFKADASSTINVTVTANIPTNDIKVDLVYGGKTVHDEDTGVGQETFVYSVDKNSGGNYTVKVCKSGNPATPFLPLGGPYPYTGLWSDVPVALPPLPIPAPPSVQLPTTVTPVPTYASWNAKFAPATVVDPQRTEGEPLQVVGKDGEIWESGPWGFTTAQSFVHRSTDDGREYHLVSQTGLRPDAPPGGGDTDMAVDDQGNLYFADLEGLAELGTSVSHDNGMTWKKNITAVQQTAVDRQWYAVDNGTTRAAADNSVFLAFHETGVGTFIYSSPGSLGPTDAVGGLVWQNSASLPGPLQPLASDAVCAKLHFDRVKRNLYYACNEGNHVRVTVGHVGVAQRTGISYKNYDGPATPGGGSVLSLFPSCTTDSAGNVYITWIDGTNFGVYYAFSTDQGKHWSKAALISHGEAKTNEFDWAVAGAPGRLAVAWYGIDKTAKGGSDAMPSAMPVPGDKIGPATAYPWYGYAALVTDAASKKPKVAQTRFTEKPMHYGNICNSGLGCTTSPTADRQMADFFGFSATSSGALRIVYNDTTNEFDGAGLYATRQIKGSTITGANASSSAASGPSVTDPAGDAQFPHYSTAGVGPNIPQLDLRGLKVSQHGSILRFQITVANMKKLIPPAGKTSNLWLVRFLGRGPLATEKQDVFHVYYVYMEKAAGVVPQYKAGIAACQTTTPTNCKVLQYRGDKAASGSIKGNTITIDAGIHGGFGIPIVGHRLYSVTAFTFGRNNSVDDLYADVDATQPFDFTVK